MPQIAEALGAALLIAILYMQSKHGLELLELIDSGYFYNYRMKGGSIFAFMASKYLVDVSHYCLLIFLYCVMVYGLGFSIRNTWPLILPWIFFDPFFVYLFTFIFSSYNDAKQRLQMFFGIVQILTFSVLVVVPAVFSTALDGS